MPSQISSSIYALPNKQPNLQVCETCLENQRLSGRLVGSTILSDLQNQQGHQGGGNDDVIKNSSKMVFACPKVKANFPGRKKVRETRAGQPRWRDFPFMDLSSRWVLSHLAGIVIVLFINTITNFTHFFYVCFWLIINLFTSTYKSFSCQPDCGSAGSFAPYYKCDHSPSQQVCFTFFFNECGPRKGLAEGNV